MDDRRRDRGAGRPRVRDRERSTGNVVRRQPLRPGTGSEVAHLVRECAEPLAVRVAHDGDDQSLVMEVDGDAEVHGVVQDELAVTDRRVHTWTRGDGVDHGTGYEGKVGEPGGAALPLHSLEIDFDRDEGVRRDGQRTDHVLAGEPLRPVERYDLDLRRRLEHPENVLTSDASGRSRPV